MSELSVSELYAQGLERLLALADDLTDADGDVATPACPLWTVKDVYSHLAGACADVTAGRVEGAGSDEWTGVQVAERKDRGLGEVVAEYRELGPKMVEALAAFPVERLAVDQWSHEQDIRGALGRPGSRDVAVVPWAVAFVFGGMARAWPKRDLPPIRVEVTSQAADLGAGPALAAFATTDFEFLRGVLGRRSPEQLRSWAQPGGEAEAVEAAVAALPVFGPRQQALAE